MSIFPDEVSEAADRAGGYFVKGVEFEKGLTVQAVKVEKVKASNPKYGAQEKDKICQQEILEEGETFEYTLQTPEGEERKLNSSSFPLFIGFRQAEIEPNDWVKITRTGKGDKTRYTVEKVEKPKVSQAKTDYPEGSSEDVPF